MEKATVHYKRTVVAKGGKADLLIIAKEECKFENVELQILSESNGEQLSVVIHPVVATHGKPPAARQDRSWISKALDLIKTIIETAAKIFF
jgi:aromatic ring-cleaving dioxygenase